MLSVACHLWGFFLLFFLILFELALQSPCSTNIELYKIAISSCSLSLIFLFQRLVCVLNMTTICKEDTRYSALVMVLVLLNFVSQQILKAIKTCHLFFCLFDTSKD